MKTVLTLQGRRIRCLCGRLVSWLPSSEAALACGEPFFTLLGRRRRRRRWDLSEIRRILVVRLDDIGDMVLTTPFLRELRNAAPTAWITLVAKPSVYELVEHCPYVNEVLAYDPGPPGEATSLSRMWRTMRFAARYLWRRTFDLAIVPRWDTDLYHASFVAYWSGALWRVGYSEKVIEHKCAMNEGFDRLYSEVLTDSAVKHEVMRGLDLVRWFGRPVEEHPSLELWTTEADEKRVETMLKIHGVRARDFLVSFGVGAASATRRWPCENFVEVGIWLRNEYGARIIIVGGQGDVSMAREIWSSLGRDAINMAGVTSLRELGTLLKACSLYVGNDSGPMHMAAAAGVPVVEISCHPVSGDTSLSNSPQRFSPWGVVSAVLQPENLEAGCRRSCLSLDPHCIRNVGVQQVKEAIRVCLGNRAFPERCPSTRVSA